MLFLKFGDEVKIVNPNHYDFGFEGIITEMSQDADEQIRYKIFKNYDIGGKEAWAYAYEIALINEPKMTKVEIDKNGVRLGKNLFEFNKEGIQIKPFRDYGDDAADAIKYYVEYKEYKEEKEEREKDDMKILNIYEDRKSLEIAKKYKEEIEKTKSEDAFESLRLNVEKQVKELYKNEFNKEFSGMVLFESDYEARLLTSETKEKIKKLEEDKKIALVDLDEFLEEVRAQLEIAKDYDTQIKILKRYDILGKDNKINA